MSLPQFMRHEHRPPESYGDCYRCALATMLNMVAEDVPHFMFDGPEVYIGQQRIREFLALHDLTISTFPFYAPHGVETLLEWSGGTNPDVPYLLTGISERGFGHTVLCLGSNLLHDPHPSYRDQPMPRVPALSPDAEGWLWVETLCPLLPGAAR